MGIKVTSSPRQCLLSSYHFYSDAIVDGCGDRMNRRRIGWVLAGSALGFVLAGLVGFCPMCAMVGRRLDKKA